MNRPSFYKMEPRPAERGTSLHAMIRDLFPLCRSITGPGLRATLRYMSDMIDLTSHEVASGTPLFDWTVPDEWTIRAASIETVAGRRLVDFAENNLHVVGYSRPVDTLISRADLARHVHTLPAQPDLIPYRTGYHADGWGICLSERQWAGMTDAAYRVVIDSDLRPGSLTYGEFFAPGEQDDEILISVHCCHPSLANDNLSGIAIATELARQAQGRSRRRGLRILFVPATIGPIAWLARNPDKVSRIFAGLVLTCLGDNGGFHYKRSRRDVDLIDRVVARIIADRGAGLVSLPFSPKGYDERQYCSPGFDLPVGCFMRSPNGSFPEYHTSADNLDFVSPAKLQDSLEALSAILDALDSEALYQRVDGRGEPQLGRRGLYRAVGGKHETTYDLDALLWALNLADGKHHLVDMADRACLPFSTIRTAAETAKAAGLLFADPLKLRPGDPIQ